MSKVSMQVKTSSSQHMKHRKVYKWNVNNLFSLLFIMQQNHYRAKQHDSDNWTKGKDSVTAGAIKYCTNTLQQSQAFTNIWYQ